MVQNNSSGSNTTIETIVEIQLTPHLDSKKLNPPPPILFSFIFKFCRAFSWWIKLRLIWFLINDRGCFMTGANYAECRASPSKIQPTITAIFLLFGRWISSVLHPYAEIYHGLYDFWIILRSLFLSFGLLLKYIFSVNIPKS